MARRSDTQETVYFVLELLRRIPRNRKVTAQDLHQQLENAGIHRDLRTVQRQLEMLCHHFPEIERDDRSKPFGYRWSTTAHSLAIPHLTPTESLFLLLAKEHLANLLPARIMKFMEAFFKQAQYDLGPGTTAREERAWPHKVRVVAMRQPLIPPTIARSVFEAATEALFRDRWLRVDYRNAAGKRYSAEVMPLGLVQQGPCLYLVSRFRGYTNERNLALHRIRSAEMMLEPFERPEEFDLEQYDADGRFGFGNGEQIRLSFRISREAGFHLTETPLSQDQKVVERKDGKLEITATVIDSAMLEWWLRGFGDAIENVRRQPLSRTQEAQNNPGQRVSASQEVRGSSGMVLPIPQDDT